MTWPKLSSYVKFVHGMPFGQMSFLNVVKTNQVDGQSIQPVSKNLFIRDVILGVLYVAIAGSVQYSSLPLVSDYKSLGQSIPDCPRLKVDIKRKIRTKINPQPLYSATRPDLPAELNTDLKDLFDSIEPLQLGQAAILRQVLSEPAIVVNMDNIDVPTSISYANTYSDVKDNVVDYVTLQNELNCYVIVKSSSITFDKEFSNAAPLYFKDDQSCRLSGAMYLLCLSTPMIDSFISSYILYGQLLKVITYKLDKRTQLSVLDMAASAHDAKTEELRRLASELTPEMMYNLIGYQMMPELTYWLIDFYPTV